MSEKRLAVASVLLVVGVAAFHLVTGNHNDEATFSLADAVRPQLVEAEEVCLRGVVREEPQLVVSSSHEYELSVRVDGGVVVTALFEGDPLFVEQLLGGAPPSAPPQGGTQVQVCTLDLPTHRSDYALGDRLWWVSPTSS